MNKHESKYFNTASLFDETLITILEEKDIEYISIKELCKKAGVNRSTFYLHYNNIDDLLNETIEYTTKKLVNYYKKDPRDFINNIDIKNKNDLILINKEYLKPYLEFTRDNKKVFISAYKNPKTFKVYEKYSNLQKYIINPILDKFNIPIDKRKYILEFYINGITGIIKEWTLNNCTDSIDNIISIIIECVKP